MLPEPDFSTTPMEDLRRLSWSRSPFTEHALRELNRRAYGLPDQTPRREARPVEFVKAEN